MAELQEKVNLLPSYPATEKLVPTKEVLLNEVVITPDKIGFDLNLVTTNSVVQAVACIIIAGICYYYVFPYVSSYFALAFFPLVKKPLEDKAKEVIDKASEKVISTTVDFVSNAIPETVSSSNFTINAMNSGLLSTVNIETSSTSSVSLISTVSRSVEEVASLAPSTISILIENDTISVIPSIISSSSSAISEVDSITSIFIGQVSPTPLLADTRGIEIISNLLDVIISRGPEEVLSTTTVDIVCHTFMEFSGLVVPENMSTTPLKEMTGDNAKACLDIFNSLPPRPPRAPLP